MEEQEQEEQEQPSQWTGPTQFVEEMERREAEGENIGSTVDQSTRVGKEGEEGPGAQDAVRAAAEEASGSPEKGSSSSSGSGSGSEGDKSLEDHTKAELIDMIIAAGETPPAKATHPELVELARSLP